MSDNQPTPARAGSVLMETVLAIPVLLTLLGGVMWIGQLQLNRSRLLAADRYVVWNAANRHRSGVPDAGTAATLRNDLQQQPHRPGSAVDPDADWNLVRFDREAGGGAFAHWLTAEVQLMLSAPAPVHAMLLATDIQQGRPPPPEDETGALFSSEHFPRILARSPDYGGTRYNAPTQDGILTLDSGAVSGEGWYAP